MGVTYISCNLHIVFATKMRLPLIIPEIQDELWKYFGGIARERRMKLLSVGGTHDHVHLLISLPTTLSIAEAVKLYKGSSSRWLGQKLNDIFRWQEGYSVFSVSDSLKQKVKTYIDNQKKHHENISFEDEIKLLGRASSSSKFNW